MKPSSTHDNDILKRFENWLEAPAIRPRQGFRERLRHRLEQMPADPEEAIDELLKPDPSLKNPYMAARIRARLQESPPDRRPARWFQWAAPIAAAALLTLTFISFQTHAPQVPGPRLAQPEPVEALPPATAPDSELTRIFALAANLQTKGDMTRLKSVDELAFLFE